MALSLPKTSTLYQLQLLTAGNAKRFRCSSCGKYLSVGPINSSVDCAKNFCGRCLPLEDSQRSILYEELAKYLLFPCSVSEDCKILVEFNDIAHESTCSHRLIECPLNKCKSHLKVASLVKHLRSKHLIKNEDKNVFSINVLLPGNLIFNRGWAFEDEDVVYYLQIFANNDKVGVNLFNMTIPPYVRRKKFSFSISINDRRINFNQFRDVKPFPFDTFLKNQCSGIANLKFTIMKTFGIYKSMESHLMNFSLNIYSPDISNANLIPFDCLSIISESLKCSACHRSLSSCMMCGQGHSVCIPCSTSKMKCCICNTLYIQGINPMIQSFKRFFF